VDALDRDAFLWIVEHRVGVLDPVFVALSVGGYAGLLWIGLAVVLALTGGRSVLGGAVYTAACVWLADLVVLAVKAGVDRPRPFDAMPTVDVLLGGTVGHSFPSGHAATSAAGALALALVYPRAASAFVALAAAVAYSRVYVGVHYPGDVLGGLAFGLVVGALAAAALRPRLRP
jgi:undecaprenyl-diphosphatase